MELVGSVILTSSQKKTDRVLTHTAGFILVSTHGLTRKQGKTQAHCDPQDQGLGAVRGHGTMAHLLLYSPEVGSAGVDASTGSVTNVEPKSFSLGMGTRGAR